MTAAFRVATSPEDLTRSMVVRGIVFCGEQGIAYAVERDEFESGAIHVLGEIDGEPIAAGRLRLLDGYAKLERIAVRAPYRGQGIGHQLTDFLISVAREHGYTRYQMNAQCYLEGFYAEHGFRAVGDRFLEADIEHVLMIRED